MFSLSFLSTGVKSFTQRKTAWSDNMPKNVKDSSLFLLFSFSSRKWPYVFVGLRCRKTVPGALGEFGHLAYCCCMPAAIMAIASWNCMFLVWVFIFSIHFFGRLPWFLFSPDYRAVVHFPSLRHARTRSTSVSFCCDILSNLSQCFFWCRVFRTVWFFIKTPRHIFRKINLAERISWILSQTKIFG